MLSRLSSRSGPLWLQQQRFPSNVTFCPLLLLPGDGGEGVEVEASLLLACSPLLRRTLASTCCGAFSGASVILASTTSDALNQLVQVHALEKRYCVKLYQIKFWAKFIECLNMTDRARD